MSILFDNAGPLQMFIVIARGVNKKKFWYCPLGGGGQKNFLCTFNDQFKQIFFVGGVIFNEKTKKNQTNKM